MKKIFFLSLLLTGCGDVPQPLSKAQTDNSDYRVEKLFTSDSCTVYRFYDMGNYRYFTNCKGTTTWRESAGKTTREVEVPGSQ